MESEYNKGDLVAVLNGTLDTAGLIDTSGSFGRVLHVGLNDLFVEFDSSSRSRVVVPKSICVLVQTSAEQLASATIETPGIGDLVLYDGKPSWRDKEPKQIVGIVYEIEYRHGAPATITVMSNSEMVRLPNSSILVLQKKTQQS